MTAEQGPSSSHRVPFSSLWALGEDLYGQLRPDH